MPFKSRKQQAYLYAKKPEVAEEFAEHTPKSAYKRLPEHVGDKPKHMAMKPKPKPKSKKKVKK